MIYGEDPLKVFDSSYPIEIYNSDTSNFEGQKEIFSKFGIQIQTEYTILMSRRSFLQYVKVNQAYQRPREGDLLWIPHVRGQGILFEITYVNPEKDMFMLNRRYPYFYEVKMEPFKYSNEIIQTGIPEVDAIPNQDAFTISFILNALNGSGEYIVNEVVYQGPNLQNATATAYVSSWNNPLYKLNVTNIQGVFSINSNVIGSVSRASWKLLSYDSFGTVLSQEPMDNEITLNESLLSQIFNPTDLNPLGTP